MPRRLNLAVSQSFTRSTPSSSLSALAETAQQASRAGAHILLFPEAYLGGYPRGTSFGTSIGARSNEGRNQFVAYYQSAADLGDTAQGAGDDWVKRRLPVAQERGEESRGDGTREYVEDVARETGVFLVIGIVERTTGGGSLYCSVIYVDPVRGCIGKHRKIQPTGTERVIWSQGGTETLKAVTTVLGPDNVQVRLAATVCWENYMPLLRQAIYMQGVDIWLAPTADGRETWLSLLRTIGVEGRCFVMSANQCLRTTDLPEWIHGEGGKSQQSEEVAHKDTTDTGTNGTSKRRRSSIITKTEDNHEITWPLRTPKIDSLETGTGNGPESAIEDANGSVSPSSSSHSFNENSTKKKDDRLTTAQPSKSLHHIAENHILALPSTTSSTDPGVADSDLQKAADEFISHGGSCIVSPQGEVLAGPLWDDPNGLLVREVDLDDRSRGHLDLDVAGSYGRLDSFELKVKGLDLNPPP